MPQSALITVITNAIMKAAKPLRRDFGEVAQLQVSRKGTANFVTNADLRTEQIIIEELQRARKSFGILSEERGAIGDTQAEYRFIIDPIDGTTNFIHAIGYFCIAVAVEKRLPDGDYEPVTGVIYDPVQDELFIAEKGQGATVNNSKLRVSGREQDLLLATAAPRLMRRPGVAVEDTLQRMVSSGATIRCAGAAALDLAYVAAGRYDGVWHYHLKPWDIAAGILLIREAGGTVSDMEGGSEMMTNGQIIASNGLIHPYLHDVLNAHSDTRRVSSS